MGPCQLALVGIFFACAGALLLLTGTRFSTGAVVVHGFMCFCFAAFYLTVAAIGWCVRRLKNPQWSLSTVDLMVVTVIIWVLATL